MASKKARVRQYSWIKRANKHGFRKRKTSPGGRSMLKRRRAKGRTKLAPQRKGK